MCRFILAEKWPLLVVHRCSVAKTRADFRSSGPGCPYHTIPYHVGFHGTELTVHTVVHVVQLYSAHSINTVVEYFIQ